MPVAKADSRPESFRASEIRALIPVIELAGREAWNASCKRILGWWLAAATAASAHANV